MSAADHLQEAILAGCTRDDHDHVADHRSEVLREAGGVADRLIATVQRTDPEAFARVDAYRNYSDELHAMADGKDTGGAAQALAGEFTPATHTDWVASHDSDGIAFGRYTNRAAAMDHIHHLIGSEEHASAEAIQLRVIWRADDPHGPEDAPTAWECWLLDDDMADDNPTGYVVTPVEVAAVYVPQASIEAGGSRG
ncbi:hypothetical protein VSR01_10580 [Actinacidiphila sp. DG2A-62]|uniref:hypothetical protein n=1 Tax=Actinacidiphila sp. DG2A-62 TaxID=3108821 RepID=UPI002DBEFD1E|nr:hypothetical protein [Actinacidiphila sp. DG2A-62]MEC3993963.1 hypothetical protein [Actinacidiphila sp. DG2A-62]